MPVMQRRCDYYYVNLTCDVTVAVFLFLFYSTSFVENQHCPHIPFCSKIGFGNPTLRLPFRAESLLADV